jgi:DNA modification methylase
MTVSYLVGQVLDQLATIPDRSVDLVATSPPFLALRDYDGLPGQWGSEPHPAAFLDHLLALTVELRRVLTPYGSIAVELGDTYSGSGGAGGDYAEGGMRDSQQRFNGAAATARAHAVKRRTPRTDTGWPPAKSLTGVPTLFAWSLAYGRNLLNPCHTFEPWLVRNVIVWARNNPPVGALSDKVRPATSYITVACPSPRRWFDLDAVRQPAAIGDRVMRQTTPTFDPGKRAGQRSHGDRLQANNSAGAPPLDHWHDEYDGDHTWLINTQGSSLAHYAMWPAKLAERLILTMCPREVCQTCGEPRRRLVDDCGHGNYRPGHVLDPFAGTGTTLAVADIHGRDATGIDLDPINHGLYESRYQQCWRSLKPDAGQCPITNNGEQLGLELAP